MITTSGLLKELYTKSFGKGRYKKPKLRKPKRARKKKKSR